MLATEGMLREIRISNLAIVPESHIIFDIGLNILTGETGAGKSILLDAIGLLAGRRAQIQDVRSGAQQAIVEGVLEFEPTSKVWAWIEQFGLEKDVEETILIRRMIGADGKSRAYLNDSATTVATLAELSRFWLDITGQHSQQRLMESTEHTDILDGYAAVGEIKKDFQFQFESVRELDRQMRELKQTRQKTLEEREYYEFRLKELVEADLKPDEEQRLTATHERAAHQEKLVQSASLVETLIEEEDGALSRVSKVYSELKFMNKLDTSLSTTLELADQALTALNELQGEVMRYRDKLGADPDEIELINARLATLQKIKRKFGSIEQAIKERDRIKVLLSSQEEGDLLEKELLAQRQSLAEKMLSKAKELSRHRKQAATVFSKEVTGELVKLGMTSGSLEVRLSDVASGLEALDVNGTWVSSSGLERAEFYFTSNPGESPRPLDVIASGGELSRVLLALKGIGLRSDGAKEMTFVFDEIDAGIGGEVAERVGLRLAHLAQGRQVLCVTHLAQVASYASSHLHVEKRAEKGRTVSDVKKLSIEERKKELARMIGGIEVTKKTQDHANELFMRATNFRTSSLTGSM